MMIMSKHITQQKLFLLKILLALLGVNNTGVQYTVYRNYNEIIYY